MQFRTMSSLLVCGLLFTAGFYLACSESAAPQANQPPNLREIIVFPPNVVLGGTARVTALVSDPDGDPLTVTWSANGGDLSSTSDPTTFWTAPEGPGANKIFFTATDGELAIEDSVQVLVGEGSIYVTSDPPGANVSLDGATSLPTPQFFDKVPIGLHRLTLDGGEFLYAQDFVDVQTAHNAADTIVFTARETQFEIFDLGRDDIEEIGPVTFLRNGAGIVYTARTTEFGVGLYSSALTPQTGQPNATRVTPNVTLGEKIGILGDDEYLAWTSSNGALLVAQIFNPEDDGHINQIRDTGILRNFNTYGIASSANRLAYSVTESFEPEAAQLLFSETENGLLLNTNTATTTPGRQPTWDPRLDIKRLAWQQDGNILFAFIEGFIPTSPDTMKTEGFCQLPAWSPFGDRPVAYVQGPSEVQAFEVRVQHIFSPHAVSIFPSLFDPRGLAWSPVQRVLAVAHNPGKGQVVLLFDLPLP